jgi:serine/threonine-protein kinase
LRDLSTGIKIGIVGEKDFVAKDRSVYSKMFRKSDRIFLTGKAYREIKSSNRFKVQTLGQFNLKYLKETLGLHEVAWRNPLDDLKFGYIKKLGRFDLLAEIASKGIFKVYKAKDSILQRFVILKVVQSESFNSLPINNPQKTAFYNLAKSLGQMSHPNIANIYEVDEDQGLTYIAREFVEGVPMSELFMDTRQFSPERLIQIMIQICKGLYYCHQQGFYHLNLKPNNIRIGLNDQTKIMDFFIPRELFEDYQNLVEQNDRMYYLSPEQIQGKLGDVRSDIFALGTILYQVVTRINPFSGGSYNDVAQAIMRKHPPPPTELNPGLPKICEAIILRCLAKNPEGRFETVNQIITMLKKTFDMNGLSNFNHHIAQSRDAY